MYCSKIPVILLVIFTWTGIVQCNICGSDAQERLWRMTEPIIAGETLYESDYTALSILEGEDYIQVENGTFTAKKNLSLDNDPHLCANSSIRFTLFCDNSITLNGHLIIEAANNFDPQFPKEKFVSKIREEMPSNYTVMDVDQDNKPFDKDCRENVYVLGTSTSELNFDAKLKLISTKQVFDYEAGDREFNLTLRAQDTGNSPRTSTFVFILQIEDYDDMDPVFSNDSYTLHVFEGTHDTPGEWVPATPLIDAFDQDLGINAPISYSIQGKSFANANASLSMNDTNGMLKVDGTLDRETVDTYRFTIKAEQRDNSRRFATSTLTLIVDDINDNRPVFNPVSDNIMIQEHTPDSVNIIKVHATDADIGNNSVFSYALTSETEIFTIDPQSGYIRVKNSSALDRETNDTYIITVNATEKEEQVGDPCSASCTATVTITLQDINDHAPKFDKREYDFSANNASIGESIGQVTATDKDFGDNGRVEYSVPNGTAFRVDNDSGIITLKEAAMKDQTFLISACDFGLNRLCGTALVTVTVPMHAVQSSNVTVNVTENVAVNTAVYVLKSDYVGYVLEMQSDIGPFSLIDDPNRILTSGEIDRETTSKYVVPINVILQNQTKAVLTVHVHVLDENDNAPVFNKSSYNFNVADDAKAGDDVGQVKAYDMDEGVNGEVTYSLQGYQSSQHFDVDKTSGQITLKSIPDLARTYMEVVIVAKDNGTHSRKNTTAVKVFVGQVPGKVRFFVHADKEEVEADRAELISGMSEILKVTVAFDEVRAVTSPYGPSCAIYLTATHPVKRAATRTGAVDEDDLRGRVEENYEDLLQLFAKYQGSSSPKDDNPFTIPVIVLIAVAAALLLVTVLVTALLFRRSNRYRRQARLASVLNRGSTIYDTQEVKVDIEDEESVHSLTGSLASRQLLGTRQPNGTAIGVVNNAFDSNGETHDTETQYTHVEDEEDALVNEGVIADESGGNNAERETGEVTPNPDYINAHVSADDINPTVETDNTAVEVGDILEDHVQTTETSEISDTVEPHYINVTDNHEAGPQTLGSKDNVENVYAVVNKNRSENLPPPPSEAEAKAEKDGEEGEEDEEEEEEDLPPPPPTPPRVRKSDNAEEEEVESSPEDEPEPDYAKKVRFSEVKVTVIAEKEQKVESDADVVDGSETEVEEDTKRDRPFETIESPADNLSDDGTFLMTAL